jgi:hypothetical protein
MKEIQLTQGMVALVDDEDFERLSQYKWYALADGNTFYARRHIRGEDGKQKVIQMHREILKLTAKNIECDHINHNGIDNQKHNLRCCTRAENSMNQMSRRGSSSKYKGVSWYKTKCKWCSQIRVNGLLINLGYYDNEEDAAKVYDAKARELFGEFAYLNFNQKEKQLCQI